LFPLYDDIRSSKPPVVTKTLIGVNIIVFLYELSLGNDQLRKLMYDFGVVPWLVNNPEARDVLGFRLYRTFFTFMFLHGGWLHIISNMWYLWIFGDNVEDRLGHWRFLIFYLLCGIASGLVHTFFAAGSKAPCIGASGAVAGVLGAYIVCFPRARVMTIVPVFFFFMFLRLPAVFLLGIWFFMQLLNSTLTLGVKTQGSGVAYWAHVGGFIAGIILLGLLIPSRRKRKNYFAQ